jgi:tyrosinase
VVLVLVSIVSADLWFWSAPENAGLEKCPGPTVRRAWSAFSAKQKSDYVRIVNAMKTRAIGFWGTGTGTTQSSLYDIFPQIHNTGTNKLWHYTSCFPYAHKAFLHLYEQAVFWTGLKYGPSLYPPISRDDVCDLQGIPYWDWETDSANPSASSVWDKDPAVPMWGDSTPMDATAGGYVDSGLFTLANGWKLIQNTGSSPYSDKQLKRRMKATDLSQTVTSIADSITKNPTFEKFITICHGQHHFSPHTYLFYSMASQASPDEPLFFMHHANVDRLFAMWCDCNEYEKKSGGALGCPNEYCDTNPVSDSTKTVYDGTTKSSITLDTQVTLYFSSSGDSKICPKAQWALLKDLHTSGYDNPSSQQAGWQGLHVRYGGPSSSSTNGGPDPLAVRIAPACTKQTNGWTVVNYGGSKKRDVEEVTLTENAEKEYAKFDLKYAAKMEKGLSPQDAIHEMAMEECMETPKPQLSQENLAMMRMMGISPSALDRICDDPSPVVHNSGRPVF